MQLLAKSGLWWLGELVVVSPVACRGIRVVYEGCSHRDLNLLPYGGKLFDPQRFPVLEER